MVQIWWHILSPGDIHIYQLSGSSLVQLKIYYLFDVKSLPDSITTYCQHCVAVARFQLLMKQRGHFHITILSHQYKNSHYKDKKIALSVLLESLYLTKDYIHIETGLWASALLGWVLLKLCLLISPSGIFLVLKIYLLDLLNLMFIFDICCHSYAVATAVKYEH